MTEIDLARVRGGYEGFYGLAEPPFSLNPDPRFLFDSRGHSTAFDLVMEAFRRRETLIVITGEIGTGKTVLCRTILQRLPKRTFLSVITNPLLDSTDLLKQVLEDFGIQSRGQEHLESQSRHDLIRALERFLTSLHQLQAHAVIMIDEAQHLHPDVLEQVRLLSNFEVEDGQTPLQIVLVGQPNLNDVLARPEMRQLQQRVSHRCELQPLEEGEVAQYIAHRLSVARGGADDPGSVTPASVAFSPRAVKAITGYSGGLPRVVNLLCDRAMEDAAGLRATLVDVKSVSHAASDLGLETATDAAPATNVGRYLIVAAVIILLAVAAWFGAERFGILPAWLSRAPASPPAAAPPASQEPAAAAVPEPAPPPAQPAPAVSTLREGEIFTVLVASFRTPTRASTVAQQIAGLSLPSFIRVIPGDWRAVLVGPYASREETVDVQSRLDAALLTGSRTVSVGQTDAAPGDLAVAESAVARTLLLPALDRQAIVVDLAEDAQRAIVLESSSDQSVDVEIGSFTMNVAAQDFTPAASGVIDRVEIRSLREQGRTIARVSVKTHTPVVGTVRFAARRVYIDLVPKSDAVPQSSVP